MYKNSSEKNHLRVSKVDLNWQKKKINELQDILIRTMQTKESIEKKMKKNELNLKNCGTLLSTLK